MWQIYGALNAPSWGIKSQQQWEEVTRGAILAVNHVKDERQVSFNGPTQLADETLTSPRGGVESPHPAPRQQIHPDPTTSQRF